MKSDILIYTLVYTLLGKRRRKGEEFCQSELFVFVSEFRIINYSKAGFGFNVRDSHESILIVIYSYSCVRSVSRGFFFFSFCFENQTKFHSIGNISSNSASQ